MIKTLKPLLVLGLTLHTLTLFAGEKGKVSRVLPAGVVFPAFNDAPLVNASSLPSQKSRAARLGYGPRGATASRPDVIEGDFSASSQSIGIGFMYTGLRDPSTITHGFGAGVGLGLGPAALGLAVRDSDLSQNNNSPSVDFSLTLNQLGGGGGGGGGLNLTAVFYNMNHSAQLTAGIGVIKEKKYFLEANLGMEPFNSANSSPDNTVAVAAGVYAGPFGFSFKTAYLTQSRTYRHTLGGAIGLGESLNLSVQFDTPNDFIARLQLAF